jgi:hypothetical protein
MVRDIMISVSIKPHHTMGNGPLGLRRRVMRLIYGIGKRDCRVWEGNEGKRWVWRAVFR